MKDKIKNLFIIIIIFFIIVFLLKNNNIIKDDVVISVNLWLTRVFPSLFPMLIINDILIACHLPEVYNRYFSILTNKLFKISGTGSYVFFMSILSGTPANAHILKQLYQEEKISLSEANKVLTYSYFSNPIFLYTMLSLIFSDLKIVISLIVVHYLSNFIIGIIVRSNKIMIKDSNLFKTNKFDLSKTIIKGMDTMIMVLGTITFYSLAGVIITNLFPFKSINLLTGFLEITEGLNMLANTHYSLLFLKIFSISIISFGGLSIHSQIKSIIADTDIKYQNFLYGRILHVLISIILILLLNFLHIC